MLDDILIIPLEISNEDLLIILQISKILSLPRNETIRLLIRLGVQKLIEEGKLSSNNERTSTTSNKKKT